MKTFLSILSAIVLAGPTLRAQNGTTNTLPIVSIRVGSHAVTESGVTNAVTVARVTTNLTSSLTVLYAKSGAASNGVDYVELPESITIPAGAHNTSVPLVAIDDNLPEPTENIILTLRPSEFYQTNSMNKVIVPIVDNDNILPTVQLVSPTNNSVFTAPTNIQLRAEANDADGTIRRVEFYRNNLLMGIVTNQVSGSFHFTWTNAQPGTNTLFAKALDNLEARGTSALVKVVIQQAPVATNIPPTATIISPTNNSSFAAPANIVISAQASDSDGYIKTVEFYSGTNRLALITNQPTASSPPATSFQYAWTNVAQGEYTLKVKATDNAGAIRISEPVFIHVTGTNPPPRQAVVTIAAVDGQAEELSPYATALNTAIFSISRRENTNVALTIFYTVSGNASNGVDYFTIPGSVTLPSGKISTNLVIRPIDDALIEPNEFVIITLTEPICPAVFPPPPECYLIGDAGSAAAVILDNDSQTNKPPAVTLFSPTNGTAFTLPTNIVLKAEAHDTDGFVRRVEFYRSNILLGVSTNPTSAGFQFNWTNPPVGSNMLVAVAVDNLEAKTSSHPVFITVKGSPVPTNIPPTVAIMMPTNNSSFTAPTNVSIFASAGDEDGFVRTVEFLAGTNRLVILTNSPESGGAMNLYQYDWENVPVGDHVLKVKATDNSGVVRISEPVFIHVLGSPQPPTQPVVTIMAIDSEASEGATVNSALNTATFSITRRENTNVALTVYYNVSGTASNGVDYATLPGSVTLPSGKLSTNLVIKPVDDALVESNETVIVSLAEPVCVAVYPPPPECYVIGAARQASAVIIDNDRITNQPPVVQLLSPTNNSVFMGPLNIPIAAEASDADGAVVRVDFFAGDRFLGSRTSEPYTLVWSNVPPSIYSVRARATDDKGAVRYSEASKITVRSLAENSFVRRMLPIWYVPGVKVKVHLRAEPRTNTTSYVVTETPPEGWSIQVLGEHGTVNAGSITFGPFNDAVPRTFAYEVTSNVDDTGEKRFAGSASANDQTSPILGSAVITSAPPHPADRDPRDWSISAEESAAYSLAWRRCERWPLAPNPIPVNYATRAAYLFANESSYELSTHYPTPVPPMLWISAEPEVAALSVNDSAWTTNRLGTAICTLPTNYVVGVPITASIAVTLTDGVKAFALEEVPPLGFAITNVSEGGIYCPLTRKVRWGVFTNPEPVTVSYQLVATTNSPSIARFAGVLSCNGINQPITGRRETRRAATIAPARFESIKTLSDGNRLLTFQGEAGLSYVLEATSDLTDWKPLAEMLNSDGNLQYIDPSTNEVNKFYRAVPRE